MTAAAAPSYLRLGRDEKPKELVLPAYAPWRRVLAGGGPVLVIVGPLAGRNHRAAALLARGLPTVGLGALGAAGPRGDAPRRSARRSPPQRAPVRRRGARGPGRRRPDAGARAPQARGGAAPVHPPRGARVSLGPLRLAALPPPGIGPRSGEHRGRPAVRDFMTPELEARIRKLHGPVLVLGASGFIGANPAALAAGGSRGRLRDPCFTTLPGGSPASRRRTSSRPTCWSRRTSTPSSRACNRAPSSTASPTAPTPSRSKGRSSTRPTSSLTVRLLQRLQKLPIACYVHAGSSSEYGDRAAGPTEDDLPQPNSDYAVSKVACANLLQFYGKKKKFPLRQPAAVFDLRPASRIHSRLIPAVVKMGLAGTYPQHLREPRHLTRLRLRRRRGRGLRRRRAQPDRRTLRRLLQHRQRPQDHHRRGGGGRRRGLLDRGPPELPGDGEPEVGHPRLVLRPKEDGGGAALEGANRVSRRPPQDRGLVSKAGGPGRVPPVVETVRPRHQAQRVGDRGLLQGRPGDPHHVRTPEEDVRGAEDRVGDRFRQ